MQHFKTFLLIAFATFLTAQAEAKDFYKCVKEDKSVSYSHEKPVEGCVSVTVVHTYAGSSTKYDPLAATGQQKDGSEEEADKSLEEQAQKQKEEVEKVCEAKRKNLDVLTSTARVNIRDPETGDIRILNEEEHQEKISSIREFLSKHCD